MSWISVEDQTPKNGKPVLARCLYSEQHGTYRQFVGEYYAKHSGEASADCEIFDYDENTDRCYIPEGWYEQSLWNDEYSSMFVHHQITHWQPLPEPPK